MHALIVVSHPDHNSLTHAIATTIAEGLTASGPHTAEIADLAAEGFDPRFTAVDIALHLRTTAPSSDILNEQARLDRADALVLVYPVYWWSLPALLKGWIDRVFSNGWAYDYDKESDGRTIPKLARLPVHMIAIGGADRETYTRHGYSDAMKTQISHGIFEYCGACVVTSELLLLSDLYLSPSPLDRARDIGRHLFRFHP